MKGDIEEKVNFFLERREDRRMEGRGEKRKKRGGKIGSSFPGDILKEMGWKNKIPQIRTCLY